jgi:hypothetical protein
VGTRGRKVGWTIAERGRFHGIDQSVRYEVDDGGGRGEDGMMCEVVEQMILLVGWFFGADSYGQTRDLELQSSITSNLDNSRIRRKDCRWGDGMSGFLLTVPPFVPRIMADSRV